MIGNNGDIPPKKGVIDINTTFRDAAIWAVLAFSIFLIFYVSIPDYPKDAPAWAMFLWGEKSQWWSEISWIIIFCAATTDLLLLRSWQDDLKPSKNTLEIRAITEALILISLAVFEFNFALIYFNSGSFIDIFLLDKGGWLHGFFYLLTIHLVILAYAEWKIYENQKNDVLEAIRDGRMD